MNRRTKFFLWKLGITIVSFICVILIRSDIDWRNLSNNYINLELCREIIYDLSAGVFSSMILVWFIDEINDHIQEENNKKAEKLKINRINRVLQKYIERYELFFYCVVTPIDQRKFENIKMPNKFSFKDMRELYLTTMLISEGIFASSIECFSKAEAELRDEIKLMLRDVEFNYFPEIRDSLLEFVEVSLKYDQRNAWLNAKNAMANNKTLADVAGELLGTEADGWYQEIKSGEKEHPHSLLHPYIALYEMLIEERRIILNYKEKIQDIDDNSGEKDINVTC